MPRRFATSTGLLRPAFACIFALWLAGGCAGPVKKKPEPTAASALVCIQPDAYPKFIDDMHYDGLAHGISKSLAYLARVPSERRFTFGPDTYTAAHLIRSLQCFEAYARSAPSAADLGRWIADNFRVYRATGAPDTGKVLFTGYYEPLLKGSRVKSGPYRFPVYARPDDHLSVELSRFSDRFGKQVLYGRVSGDALVPYYDRQQIDNADVLAGKARCLAWLKDPVDRFFLHIQGSGKIFLDNGQTINVHYHTTNGRPYRSIGKFLIEAGAIAREQMSMQAIRRYLNAHPEKLDTVLNANPSYVFFKLESDGPLGCLDVKLTAGRSVATDHRLFPSAALCFVQTQKPLIDAQARIERWAPLQRFVLNQDTGGAIRGPARADLFWGNGPYAELAAGHMQHAGALYFLVLKPGFHGPCP